SFQFIHAAIDAEVRRQKHILDEGGIVVQETRLFDPEKSETRSMRIKEEAHDYRYFPDPDLLPLELTQEFVDELKAHLPELPEDKRRRYREVLGLSAYDAGVLINEVDRSREFEKWIELAPQVPPKALANWLINEHLGRLRKENFTIETSPVPAAANT